MRARLAVLLAAVLGLALAAPASAEPVPAGYAYSDEWFESFDGTKLHAGVFLPSDHQPGEKHPTLVVLTPYASPNGATEAPGNTEGITNRFPELFGAKGYLRQDRWAYVQIDMRGFGGSGGCFEYYGANEARDTGVAVDWAGSQPWSTGKIGLWGKSYEAADQVLALGAKPEHLAAAVIQSAGLSAYTALWMNGVHYATGRYATTGAYTADDLLFPQNLDTASSPEYAEATAAPLTSLPGNPTCRYDAVVGMNTVSDRNDPFWADREPYKKAAGAKVPVLWSHGFYDANTKPVHMDIYSSLTGPKQAWFGQYTHVRGHEPGVGRRGFLEQAFRFLDRYVRGVKPTPSSTEPRVTVQEGNGVGRWRIENKWPPYDAKPWTMPVRPGTYADTQGNNAGGSSAGKGTWTFTAPLPHDAHLAGEVGVDVPVTTQAPGAHLVALLYDVDETGRATFVQRGAMALPALGDQRATFKLYPQDYRFLAGHRIGLLLSAGDDSWFSPGVTNTTVSVGAGTLTLPMLRIARTEFVEGGKSDGMSAVQPFSVAADTIAAATVDAPPPPAQRAAP